MRLEELTKDTSWVYRYIRGLDHEADIARYVNSYENMP